MDSLPEHKAPEAAEKSDAEAPAPAAPETTSEAQSASETKAEAPSADAPTEHASKAEIKAPKIDAVEGRGAPEKAAEAAASKGPGSALIPFVAPVKKSAEEAAAAKPKPRFEHLFAYGSYAAAIAALIGIAWALSGHGLSTGAPAEHVAKAPVPVVSPEAAERAEMRRMNLAMAEEIRGLKSNMEQLRTTLAQNQTVEEVRALKKGLEGLKGGVETAKSETNASVAQLSQKLDHLQHEAKLQQVLDRLDRIEKASAPLATGSIQAKPADVATVPGNPVSLPAVKVQAETPEVKKPMLIPNWVVRDVYDGIAVVEGPHGVIEVVPGETLPGAGTVKSIERRGRGWIVVTSRGFVESGRY